MQKGATTDKRKFSRTLEESHRSQRRRKIASHIDEDAQIEEDLQREIEEDEHESSDAPEEPLEEDEDEPVLHTAENDAQVEAIQTALGSLAITSDEEESSDREKAERKNNMADTTPTQITYGKSMVPEPGFFDGDRTKFDDWWRQMKLFMRFNKIVAAEDKMLAVIARFKGGTAGQFAETELIKIERAEDTRDWNKFADRVEESFSNDTQSSEAEWKIEEFKQGKKHTADFLIEFHVLKIRADTDDLHAIFLLKKHARRDIIKTILGYPASSIPITYTDWKKAILSVGQGYESTETPQQRTGTGITYGGTGQPMEIGRQMPAFNEKGQPKCFKCNKYGHMAKECRGGNVKGGRKCYNCDKEGHFSKNCRAPRKNRIRSMAEEEDEEVETQSEQGFVEGSE